MRHADNLDGTFTNPVIFADYPDTDIIGVGSDFYMVSSSFHHAPGIPICHSKDLINWTVIGHAYARLPGNNPAYSMQNGKTAYGRGSWAPCIRYHHGKFYVAFNTPDEGFFLCISSQPEGPYELIPFGVELYDPGLLFDDDGRVYVIHAAIGICVSELTADCRSIKSTPELIYQTAFGFPFEGSHAYKRNGWYYVCVTARGYNGLQLCLRSRHIRGPYEVQVLSGDDMNYAGAGLHQGGFIELENGETWFFLFQDRDYVGRVPVLQPVSWINEWPVIGDPKNYGKAVVTTTKPETKGSHAVSVPIYGDEFDSLNLGLQWEWSHNPDDTRWSLAKRPGWLRLNAIPAPDFLHARNTITQRIVGPTSTAGTLLDFSGLEVGDLAGLAIANIPYAFIGVGRSTDGFFLRMVNDGAVIAEISLPVMSEIYLNAEAGADGFARLYYSVDGKSYTPFGTPFLMLFTVKTFLGNRFALFCYHEGSAEGECGFADFDFLRREPLHPANQYSALDWIPASAYDSERGTDTQRMVEKQPKQLLISIDDGDEISFNQIDFDGGVARFLVNAAPIRGGRIELHLDDKEGRLIGSCLIPSALNRDAKDNGIVKYACSVAPVSGLHALHMKFLGSGLNLFRLEGFCFE